MEEILSRGGSVEMTVTGGSMEPMLHGGVSRVRLAPPRELRRGDLPLYRRENGSFVLHRVTAVSCGGYTCCGDAQYICEKNVPRGSIVAVTEAFMRSDRWRSVSSAGYGLYWRLRLASRPVRRMKAFCIRLLRGTNGRRSGENRA